MDFSGTRIGPSYSIQKISSCTLDLNMDGTLCAWISPLPGGMGVLGKGVTFTETSFFPVGPCRVCFKWWYLWEGGGIGRLAEGGKLHFGWGRANESHSFPSLPCGSYLGKVIEPGPVLSFPQSHFLRGHEDSHD